MPALLPPYAVPIASHQAANCFNMAIVGQYQRGVGCQSAPTAGARREMDRATSEGYEPAAARNLPAHGATVAFIVEKLRADILAGRLAPDFSARRMRPHRPLRRQPRPGSRGSCDGSAAEGLSSIWPNRGALGASPGRRGTIRELFQIRVRDGVACRAPRRRIRLMTRGSARAFGRGDRADLRRSQTLRRSDYLTENAAFHDELMSLAGNLQLSELATRLLSAAHHGSGRGHPDAGRSSKPPSSSIARSLGAILSR